MLREYQIEVHLDPGNQHLSARVVLDCQVAEGEKELEFFLHRDLQVVSVCGKDVSGFRSENRPFTFAPEAVTWVVSLKEGVSTRVSLEFCYAGTLTDVIPSDWHVNRLTREWVELGMYGPWFPWNPAAGPFTYSVKLIIDSTYNVVGLGKTRRCEGYWQISCDQPREDIVITAAPSYREVSRSSAASSLTVNYTEPGDDGMASRIADDGVWTIEYFTQWLGKSGDSNDLVVVIAPRNRGGGYARPGMVVMQDLGEAGKNHPDFVGYLAHELAHFWWKDAPVDSWEDWLNEAFAEYSAVKAVAARRGSGYVEQAIARKRENSAQLPPIRGLDRRHERAWNVLYEKGPVLLWALEQEVGEESFTRLVRERVARKVNSTEQFLSLLAEIAGQQTADTFSRWLDS